MPLPCWCIPPCLPSLPSLLPSLIADTACPLPANPTSQGPPPPTPLSPLTSAQPYPLPRGAQPHAPPFFARSCASARATLRTSPVWHACACPHSFWLPFNASFLSFCRGRLRRLPCAAAPPACATLPPRPSGPRALPASPPPRSRAERGSPSGACDFALLRVLLSSSRACRHAPLLPLFSLRGLHPFFQPTSPATVCSHKSPTHHAPPNKRARSLSPVPSPASRSTPPA